MKPLRLFIEYQNNDYVKQLLSEIAELHIKIEKLERANKDLTWKYGQQVMLNGELHDALRSCGINFRDIRGSFQD